MQLVLDDYLIKNGIADIRTIKNEIVILATLAKNNKEKRFAIKFKENPRHEEIAISLEEKLDKPLGRTLCQYIIQFICKPENWDIINTGTSESQVKEKAEQQSLVEKYKPKYHFDNFEQWQVAVETAYHALHRTVDDNIPQAWSGIEFILSVKAILHIKEITLPYIGIILGPPSSVKTLVLKLLRGRPYTFFTDHFNPHAMVSHAILPIWMKEGEQHMLNKMKNSVVLAPELASLFSGREEEVREIIQLMTRVADGDGLETDSGLGHKGVTGKVMFVMGGAGVEFSPMVYGLLTFFGAKLHCFRLPEGNKTHEQYVKDLKGDQFIVKFQRMKDAMNEYLDTFESCPNAQPEEGMSYYLPKISLEKFRVNDCDDAIEIIVYLGQLLRHLRNVAWTREFVTGTTSTVKKEDKKEIITETEERDFSFNTNVFEDQSRANQQHYNLAIGHALSMGRTSVAMQDIPLMVKVTLSTAPKHRHKVFELLLERGNSLSTKEIQAELHLHRSTAKRTMTELVAVGLVHWDTSGEEHSDMIVLEDNFEFFTKEEFQIAREDNDQRYKEYLENLDSKQKEVNPNPSPNQDETEVHQ
jgi:IclR-like helix-turn-helix domain-containing protein